MQGLLQRGLCLLGLLLAHAPPAHCKARRADKEALISLFRLLGGPFWGRNNGWDADGGTDPCDLRNKWYGVGCIDPCDIFRDGPDCAFGRITALTLRDNNLTGSITNWTGVGDLHNLSWIDFSVNSISGSLPAEIGQVQNIELINLAWNKLQGGLPTTLGTLNANGAYAISELSVEVNELSGTLPTELGMLTQLRMLNVGFNRISGSIPTQITNLSKLQVRRSPAWRRRARRFSGSARATLPSPGSLSPSRACPTDCARPAASPLSLPPCLSSAGSLYR